MKRGRWACSESGQPAPGMAVGWRCVTWPLAVLLIVAWLGVGSARAVAASGDTPGIVMPAGAQVLVEDAAEPPAGDDPRWRPVALAEAVPGHAAWYRVVFDAPRSTREQAGPTMLYLPYFYGGGRIVLNGSRVIEVPHTTDTLRVRRERPLLLALPDPVLQPTGNELMIKAYAAHLGKVTQLPRLVVGTQADLDPVHARRLFVVRTLPTLTWAAGTVVGLLMLVIWVQRRDEVLYGLFGLAALLWAQRTSTFVLDILPTGTWEAWRTVYFLCTGGFVVVLALFVLALAGWSRPVFTRPLIAYAALGPPAYLIFGDSLAAGAWVSGLLLLGPCMVVVAVAAAVRRRTADTVVIAVVVLLGVLAGVHDQALASRSPWLQQALPDWVQHRLFLLHHAANLLLLAMGVLLALRFVRSLNEVEATNRTLDARVRQREQEIEASYRRIAILQREQAATDERQRIMRDLHDGLGSQLFTSLSRAERGVMDSRSMADTLRSAIDQMRVAIEALASEEQDVHAAFGSFRYRWDARLRDAGIATSWSVDIPDTVEGGVPALAPHDALQLLHFVQEALTNVLKHARATRVTVRVALRDDRLTAEVGDDGVGLPVTEGSTEPHAGGSGGGRGRANMRSRARQLGGEVAWEAATPRGTRVRLQAPWGSRPLQAGPAPDPAIG